MIRRMLIPALALAAFVFQATARAQSSANADDHGQQVMQKIHDDLTAKGFTDVRVVPGSFIVSGTDKNGQPVVMLIGPNSMTVLTPANPGDASQPPQQAQQKDPSLKNWE
jgi:hypothetical protein